LRTRCALPRDRSSSSKKRGVNVDYKTLMEEAVEAMNDELLFLAEKQITEERRRRAIQAAHAGASASPTSFLIDLSNLVTAARENIRFEMSICSEAVLAGVLDQVRDYSQETGEEAVVIGLLRAALTAVVVFEARFEAARRSDSVR